jgi:hypothetical protein
MDLNTRERLTQSRPFFERNRSLRKERHRSNGGHRRVWCCRVWTGVP